MKKYAVLRAIVLVLLGLYFLSFITSLTIFQATTAAEGPDPLEAKPVSVQVTVARPTATPMAEPTAVMTATAVPAPAGNATVSVLRYELDCLDLETGTVIPIEEAPLEADGRCPAQGDVQIGYNADRIPHAVLFQNECVGQSCEQGVEVATIAKVYGDVTVSDRAALEYTRDLIDAPFTQVTILGTIEGNYYKIALLEDETVCGEELCVTLQWQPLW